MAQNFQDFKQEVLEKNELVELVSEYAKLKRVGSRYAALCPFHNDKKSPSLSISPEKQLFYCFGCGASGNAIDFIMRIENLDFQDALKYLADRAHVPIPEFGSLEDQKKRAAAADKRQRICEINAAAARYFFENLATPKGESAYQYLKKRGITNTTIKKFGLGFAPEGWSNLLDYLAKKGYKAHEVYEAGLAKSRENGSYYDVFHDGRVIFPIINAHGAIIGFGGRVMTGDGSGAKYLNSPETVVFKKKENLFGLNLAKNDRSGVMLLMEGYMDVISLHQAGIGNAVASLGTAFTPEQARLLKKYAQRAVLCYDADQAGQKATLRAGQILTDAEIKTRVLTITDGKDPDEFIQSKGPEMFRILIDDAKPLFMYRMDHLKQNYDLKDTEQVIEFTEAAAAVLAEINKPTERELYLKQAAATAGVSEESLLTQVNVLLRKKDAMQRRRAEREDRQSFERRTGGRRDLKKMGICNAESLLLNLMTEGHILRKVKASGLCAGDFSEGAHRQLAEALWAEDDRQNVDIHALLAKLTPDAASAVTAILIDDKNIVHKDQAYQQPLSTLLFEKARKNEERLMQSGADLKELDKLVRKNNIKRTGGTNRGEREETDNQ